MWRILSTATWTTTSFRCSDTSMDTGAKRQSAIRDVRILALSGFMGSGKSSVGRKLSALLSCPFIDLDEYIESHERRTIPEIFSSEGEKAFRALELQYLTEIVSGNSTVGQHDRTRHIEGSPALILSLGGGTLTTEACSRLVSGHTVCIYLRASVDTLEANLADGSQNRPMLQSAPSCPESDGSSNKGLRSRIEELMQRRGSIYESAANHIIDTDGKTVEDVVLEISNWFHG